MYVTNLRVDKQILRLDIPVNDVVLVTEFDCLEQLIYVFADSLRFQTRWPFLQDFKQILLHVFKY
jgi:hypothetical protein